MSDILVLGALHYDVVVDAPRLPVIDETLPGTQVDYRFGGKGGNQAVAAARMGAKVAMAGRVGCDAAAGTLRAALDAAGVDASGVLDTDAATGMSVAITLPSGDYGAVIVSGANLLNDGDVELEKLPKAVILQNEIPEAANLALVRGLSPAVRLIVNAAPARALHDDIVARTDILVVNRVEAEALTGHAKPSDAVKSLADRLQGAVLVTMGANGLILHDLGETRILSSHPVEVVSTHGAGDMFVGALAAGIAAGESTLAAVEFANAAAALFVSRPIAMRATLTAKDVREFMAR